MVEIQIQYIMLKYVNSISYNGLSHLIVNGFEFIWNGDCWQPIVGSKVLNEAEKV